MIYIGIGFVFFSLFYYVSVYNDIKRLNIKVDETASNIDVALAKRYTVLTQLFEVAKGYAKHEKETLVAIVEIRKGMGVEAQERALVAMETGFNRLMMVAESYPDLKADQHFLKLQDAVVETEEHLSAARRLYNSNVTRYNSRIETFPGNVIGNGLNAERKSLLVFDPTELKEVDLTI